MSGGVAYLRTDPEVTSRVNREMVEFEDLDDADVRALATLLARHVEFTGSTRAVRLSPGDFVKVMPRDYRRVLTAMALAEEQGVPVEEAVMAAARG
jgi:glutamate synthase (NADPH/NADH) large chain